MWSPPWNRDRRRLYAAAALGLTIVFNLLPGSPCWAQDDALDGAFAALLTYDWGTNDQVLLPIEAAIVTSRDRADARQALERRLTAVLRGDAPRAAKSYVCRKLQQIGTADSVPVLSELLGSSELGHAARGALEAIPGAEAVAALRNALPQLDGALRIGVVNSLGRRGDAASVPLLAGYLDADDPALAQAALDALAVIDAREAVTAVLARQDSAPATLRPAVADACLEIANRLIRAGQLDQASAILSKLETSDVEHVRWAALLGLLRAEPAAAHARLTKCLASENSRIRLAAGEWIRDAADEELVGRLAASLPRLPQQGQLCLLNALQQSPHAAVRATALEVAKSPNASLRAAAIRALARSGQPADATLLVAYATDADKAVREAAQATLTALPGMAVNKVLLDDLEGASPPKQVALIRALVARQAPDLEEVLMRLADSPTESVRLESLTALESLARPEYADRLVAILVAAPLGRVRDGAERAVWRCCSRIADPSRSVEPVMRQLRGADAARRAALLPALGRLGGEQALQLVKAAQKDADRSVRDAAIRALCNWPDATVATDLFELARSDERETYRIVALRSLARVLGRQGKENPQAALEGLREVLKMSTRTEDKEYVLSRLTAVRLPGALELTVSLLEDPALADTAVDATVDLAEGMKESHAQEARAALQKAAAVAKDPPLKAYITKLLWNMELKEEKKDGQ
jgi:HEAT repeat protein